MYKIRSIESRTTKSGKPYKVLRVVDPVACVQAPIFDFDDSPWAEGEEIIVQPYIDYRGRFGVKPIRPKR